MEKKMVVNILAPLSKSVDKLLKIEKKMISVFNVKTVKEWPASFNLGSVGDVSQRAETARLILQRAMKRKRRAAQTNKND
ncbi:MAG: hypothetical protein HQL94_06675 [Magnetococcales bacterium]|nr:hypothetical protein [Magnetococcales bacterium]MBF0438695.1 hypothetical protein [Magnetococcales bacterium]